MGRTIHLRHVLEWRLAVVAGIVAGTVFLLATIAYLALGFHISGWVVLRYMASLVLGIGVLPPPAGFDASIVLVGLVVNFVLAIVYALILAVIIHRWGLLVGIVGGAVYGAALYFINLYTFTVWFPWFFALNGLPLLLCMMLYGAVAGGVYEFLDWDYARESAPTTGGVRA